MSESRDDRHSRAADAPLITDPDECAKQEARNGLRQFDAVVELIDYYSSPERPFRLRPSTLLHLHRIALDRISSYAGNFRPADISIGGSKHQPPKAHLVPELVEDMCDYVNDHGDASPIHLAAYVLWRLNWIHPFTDGNGRTARATSYAVLCIKLGYRVPGTNTVPEQIAKNKKPYYQALEAADDALAQNNIDLSVLESYLSDLLAAQLMGVYNEARRASQKETNQPS